MSRLTNEQKREQLSVALAEAEKNANFFRTILQKIENSQMIEPDIQTVQTTPTITPWWKNVIARVQRIHL